MPDNEVTIAVATPATETAAEAPAIDVMVTLAQSVGRIESSLENLTSRIEAQEGKIAEWNTKTEQVQAIAESANSTAVSAAVETMELAAELEEEEEEESNESGSVNALVVEEEKTEEESQPESQKRPMTNLWHHF